MTTTDAKPDEVDVRRRNAALADAYVDLEAFLNKTKHAATLLDLAINAAIVKDKMDHGMYRVQITEDDYHALGYAIVQLLAATRETLETYHSGFQAANSATA